MRKGSNEETKDSEIRFTGGCKAASCCLDRDQHAAIAGASYEWPLCRHCSRTRAQGRNRENRLAFSELAMVSPLRGSAAHESSN
jgi:hypothetical protein